MSKYFYKAKNINNEIVQGTLDASSFSEAASILEQKNYAVLEIKEKNMEKPINQIEDKTNSNDVAFSLKEKKEFFNSFYFLYKSGLSVFEIFQSIISSTHNFKIRALCKQIVKKIEQGKSIKESMKFNTKALGLAYTMLIAAGEESGKLEEVLSTIIKNIKKQEEMKSHLISKLTYPVCMFFFAIAVALLFKLFVLKVFSMMGEGLAASELTGMLIMAIIQIILIFIIIFAGLFYVYKNKNLMNKITSFILQLKIFANLLKNYYFSNFFSVLALAYEAGVPVSESLYLANSVINIPKINHIIKKSEKMILNGSDLTTALGVTGLFSSYAMSQISAGEMAGEVDKALKTISFDYENRLNNAIDVILKLVEPMMLVIVGILVAAVMVTGYRGYYNYLFSMF